MFENPMTIPPLNVPHFIEKLDELSEVGLTMISVPTGSFLMGSPPEEEGRYDDEGPQHEVEIQEFFLAQTPITQAQWRAVAQWQRPEPDGAEEWPETLDPDPVARLDDAERWMGPQRPVVNVSWNDAMAFCERLRLRTGKNYTLPSEAQWEYACRAGTTTPFHFGKTISSELANYDGTATYGDGPKGEFRGQTTDVGMFPANAWGLHDMHGNVWEWCLDHWHPDYKGAPSDGRAWLSGDDQIARLLRGGSWPSPPRYCRSACRSLNPPDSRSLYLGFRVVCSSKNTSNDPQVSTTFETTTTNSTTITKNQPTFTYCFNPEDNGGEGITLSALIHRQDPDEPFVTEEFSMQSYANEASLHFNFFLTPNRLRDCANKLEKFLIANGINER